MRGVLCSPRLRRRRRRSNSSGPSHRAAEQREGEPLWPRAEQCCVAAPALSWLHTARACPARRGAVCSLRCCTPRCIAAALPHSSGPAWLFVGRSGTGEAAGAEQQSALTAVCDGQSERWSRAPSRSGKPHTRRRQARVLHLAGGLATGRDDRDAAVHGVGLRQRGLAGGRGFRGAG